VFEKTVSLKRGGKKKNKYEKSWNNTDEHSPLNCEGKESGGKKKKVCIVRSQGKGREPNSGIFRIRGEGGETEFFRVNYIP